MTRLLEGGGAPFAADRSHAVTAVGCWGFFLYSALLPCWNLILMKPGVVQGLALLMTSNGYLIKLVIQSGCLCGFLPQNEYQLERTDKISISTKSLLFLG